MSSYLTFRSFSTVIFASFLVATILFIWCADIAQAQIATNGLVSHWTFDKADKEDKTVEDVWGENDGTIMGDTKEAGGKFGEALEFDGDGDFVDVTSNVVADGQPEYTITTWFNPKDSTSGTRQMMFETSGSWAISAELSVNNNNLKYSIETLGATVIKETNIRPEEGIWQHFAIVYKENDYSRIYYNGEELADYAGVPSGLLKSTNGFHIASYRNSDGRWYNGIIDEIYIYDRALTADEILRNYKSEEAALASAQKLISTWGEIKASN